MNAIITLMITVLLVGCNAYRATPESEILYTKKDLTKRGFVLAPIVDLSKGNTTSVGDLNAFDTILSNTLSDTWKKTHLQTVGETTKSLDGELVEEWRVSVAKEEAGVPSPSSLTILKKLTQLGISYPSQVLLPAILQNTVSCGHKEALSTYLSPDPHGPKAYCQRVMKMRFRIMDNASSALVWNGIVYATQESTAKNKDDEETPLDPPSTQALIRECFINFSKQFDGN
ncbi:MAG: hypothetical protein EOP07_09670 [Proteobacteria bacterium]|nr:MAG: hypothetical protein EOP07_09670 [Pseudomonadota bacterium]